MRIEKLTASGDRVDVHKDRHVSTLHTTKACGKGLKNGCTKRNAAALTCAWLTASRACGCTHGAKCLDHCNQMHIADTIINPRLHP
jgi:hypothetical protein